MITSAIFSITLLQSSAHALSCMEGIYQTNVTSQGQVLPVNAQVVVWSAYSDPAEPLNYLVNTDTGEDLPMISTYIQSDAYGVAPEQGFQSGSSYNIVTRHSDADEEVHAQFSIGEDVDEVAPEVPVVMDVERTIEEDSWGESVSLQITLQPRSEDSLHYLVEVADNEEFENSSAALVFAYGDVLYVGTDPCTTTVPGDVVRSAKFVRVRTIDIAGNQSDFSSDFALEPTSDVASCSSAQVDIYGWAGLFGLAMIGMRRKW